MRIFFWLLVISIGLTSCTQTSFVFYPEPLSLAYVFNPPTQHQWKEVMIPTLDGEKINGIFVQNDTNKVILFLHGNAGNLASWQYAYDSFDQLGVNFLIIDYRGFGKSSGKISEEGLYADARSAYQYLLENGYTSDNISVVGQSIGTGIATDLASQHTVERLMLISAYYDFEQLAKSKVSFPIWSHYKFPTYQKINQVEAPVLFVHGTKDQVIPCEDSKALYDLFAGKKDLLLIPNCGHNGLAQFAQFSDGIQSFFSTK